MAAVMCVVYDLLMRAVFALAQMQGDFRRAWNASTGVVWSKRQDLMFTDWDVR